MKSVKSPHLPGYLGFYSKRRTMKLVSLVKVGESVGRYWLNTLGGSGWMGGPK